MSAIQPEHLEAATMATAKSLDRMANDWQIDSDELRARVTELLIMFELDFANSPDAKATYYHGLIDQVVASRGERAETLERIAAGGAA